MKSNVTAIGAFGLLIFMGCDFGTDSHEIKAGSKTEVVTFGFIAGSAGTASATLISDTIGLTNWHVYIELPEGSELDFLYRKSDSIGTKTMTSRIKKYLWVDSLHDLAVFSFDNPLRNIDNIYNRCLSTATLNIGDTATVISSAYGQFPPVDAMVTILKPEPEAMMDPYPIDSNIYFAITSIVLAQGDNASKIGPGSSGGAVVNRQNEIIGMVWSGNMISSIEHHVYITPSSEWQKAYEESATKTEGFKGFSQYLCKE